MVALGILLDTFVVRTIMVPAAVELIGDKIWWPSTARGGAPEETGSSGRAAEAAPPRRRHPLAVPVRRAWKARPTPFDEAG